MYDNVRLLMTILVMVLTALILRSITFKLARKNKLSKWYKLFNIAAIIIVSFGFSAAIIQVVDGKDTTFVAAQNSQIIPKVNETKNNVKSWKLPLPNATSLKDKYEHGISVLLYHYKGTSEYYLGIHTWSEESVQVSDSLASEFAFSKKTYPQPYLTSVWYFAYIPNPPKDYWVKVNDQTIDLSDWFS